MYTKPLVALSHPSALWISTKRFVHALALSVVTTTMALAQSVDRNPTSNPDTLATMTGVYTISAQMIMPNLEENLRYAKSTATICISEFHPDILFPILAHQSLAGCTLIPEQQRLSESVYQLVCTGTNQTLGAASVIVQGKTINGTVNIRMGGKNMTFSQRKNASPAPESTMSCPTDRSTNDHQ